MSKKIFEISMKKILARYFHKKGIDNKRSFLLANMFIQDWNVCNESFFKKMANNGCKRDNKRKKRQ